MNYSLSYSLGKTMVVTRGDADANAYIAAVEAAGATVTSTQRNAIDDFYVSAKTSSYYTSLKRLYFPIWGVAAANAIDMISLTSGTFSGVVTHSAGFVQSNGSTGTMNFNTNPNSVGLTISNALLIALTYDHVSDSLEASLGGTSGGASELSLFNSIFDCGNSATARLTFSAYRDKGICVASQVGNSKTIYQRQSSGFTTPESSTPTASGSLPTNMYAMSRGAAGFYSNNKFGAYGIGLGITSTVATSFTLHLKNLWESCTGLTLP